MENEKQLDLTPFCSQACLLQREINQVQLKLVEEMYTIKQIRARLKEIAHDSSEFIKKVIISCIPFANSIDLDQS